MKSGCIKQLSAFFMVFILSLNVVAAQPYPITGKIVDDLRIFFARGDKKAEIALEAREREINSAIENIKAGNIDEAIKELERAREKLKLVQETASPAVMDKVNLSVQEVIDKIMESKDINPEFSAYLEKHLSEEQKTQLTLQLSDKISKLCEELAMQDYELMLKEPKCDPKNAPSWMRGRVEGEMKKKEQEAGQKMVEQLTVCMSDPRECDCSSIPVKNEQAKCEKGKALAIRCEFQNDDSACEQLKDIKPEVPSNMPEFLKPLFQKTIDELIRKKEGEMFKKFAPKECVEAGAKTREECEKVMMEKFAPRECIDAGATTKEECEKIMFAKYGPPPNECMDKGRFIGPEECEEKMVKSGKIPSECVRNGKPVSREECERIMEEKMMQSGQIPSQCVKDGKFIGREECEGIMEELGGKARELGIPMECIKEGEPIPAEECEKIMEQMGAKRGGMAPPECFRDGKPIPEEECRKIMGEKGGMPQQGQVGGRGRGRSTQRIPQECVGMTFDECENFIMQKYIPKECQDANALTPEACQRIMLPQECREANAFSREECEAIMIKKRMPRECQEEGISEPEECARVMAKNMARISPELERLGIDFESLPDACKRGVNFVRGMECDKALAGMGITLPAPTDMSNIPKECIKDDVPISPEECREILKDKFVEENIPGPCREAGIHDARGCGRFMEKQRRDGGIGINMPQECFEKSPEECKKIMEEKGLIRLPVEKRERVKRICKEGEECAEAPEGEIMPPGEPIERAEPLEREEMREKMEEAKPEKPMPRECMDMGVSDSDACNILMSKINAERMKNGDKMIVDKGGNKEFITQEQVNNIAEESERRAEEIGPDTERAEEIKQEITEIEHDIKDVEERAERIELQPIEEVAREAPQPPTEQPSPPQEPSPQPAPEAAPPAEAPPAPEAPAPPAEQAPVTGTIIKAIINPFNLWRDVFERIASVF